MKFLVQQPLNFGPLTKPTKFCLLLSFTFIALYFLRWVSIKTSLIAVTFAADVAVAQKNQTNC